MANVPATQEEIVEVLLAQRDAAVDLLKRLLRQLERGQFMTPEDQAELWQARALLAECGR